MDRRDVLRLGGVVALSGALSGAVSGALPPLVSAASAMPIIDCHIHLFDPTRPGGVPWPLKTDTVLYRPAVPARYEKIARPFGVVGAIAVEASPLAGDNDWVLQQAADHPMIVGLVGDLVPGSSGYGQQLARLHRNPLFLGIRYGNLWDRDLSVDRKKPGFMDDLRMLASSGLVLESANPDPILVKALLDISQQLPELRIVIDHLPHAVVPTDAAAHAEYLSHLQALGRNDKVFIKLSEIPEKQGDHLPTEVSFYQDRLDALWEIFGDERVLFGSDWPNSDNVTGYAETLGIVRQYMAGKGRGASEKFFWRNSHAAYQWKPRQHDQVLS